MSEQSITPLDNCETKNDGDTLTILAHEHNLLAKVWLADGTIKSYDLAKIFTLREIRVFDIHGLSRLLKKLERKIRHCLIRGRYRGDEVMKRLDPKIKQGTVRRLLSAFYDQALHIILIEVDDFFPTTGDPIREAEKCAREYILLHLPMCFQEISFYWQLSSSAGHPSKAGVLKIHLWYWLKTPHTGAQLKAWVTALKIPCDPAVFSPVQIHYTATPIFANGVSDPVPVRSGFFNGLLGDMVDLEIPPPIKSTKPARRLPFPSLAIKGQNNLDHTHARVALRRGMRIVANATEGTRNSALNKVCYSLTRFVQNDTLTAKDIADALAPAALTVGLDPREVVSTLASALRAGGVA